MQACLSWAHERRFISQVAPPAIQGESVTELVAVAFAAQAGSGLVYRKTR